MKNIAILMGGYSSEFEISLASGNVVYDILKNNKKFNFYKIIISVDKWYHIDINNSIYDIDKKNFTLIKNNKIIKFDLVFNTIHGIPGENGEIQMYLDKLKIPQTSSEKEVAKLTFNKNDCKNKLKKINIITPKSLLLNIKEKINIKNILDEIKMPFFIKPNKGGSSYGISRIDKEKNIINGLKKCFKEDDEALIEEEIIGREISVGVVNYNNKVIALPPTEIISHNTFFDYKAKYKGESDEITPAHITKNEEIMIKKKSIEIYNFLKLSGFSRSDFILKNNIFYFLEVNTNPGLTKESILPQQARAANIDLYKLFNSLLKT